MSVKNISKSRCVAAPSSTIKIVNGISGRQYSALHKNARRRRRAAVRSCYGENDALIANRHCKHPRIRTGRLTCRDGSQAATQPCVIVAAAAGAAAEMDIRAPRDIGRSTLPRQQGGAVDARGRVQSSIAGTVQSYIRIRYAYRATRKGGRTRDNVAEIEGY